MALLLVFLLIFGVAFGAVAIALRTPDEQRAIERRLATLVPADRNSHGANRADSPWKDAPAGAFPQLEAWVKGTPLLRRLELLKFQTGGSRAIGSTVIAIFALALFGFVAVQLITHMLPIAAVASVLCGLVPVFRLYRLRQMRVKAFETVLPDCIDTCARALRAGHSLIAAIGMVAGQAAEPARTEFAEVFKKQNYGLPVREAFMETLERVPSADLRVFVTGILVQKDTGGNLTDVFDKIVHVIRERLRIQGEIRTHTAQGRLTAWILSLLPVALLLLTNLIDPGYSKPMFEDPLGRKLMYAGLGLLLIGAFVVRHIVNGIEV